MRITKIEIVRNKRPIELPEPWRPAWWEPDADPVKGLDFSFYKVYTDEGIVGIGPATSPGLDRFVKKLLIGFDPFYVERFWEIAMKGRELSLGRQSYGGLEIALWDIIGKVLRKPVYKIMGAYRDKIMAYVATSQLRSPEEHVKQALKFLDLGIKAIKLRMHRANLEDDIRVVRAVRDAVGNEMIIMVDANQNNLSINYEFWSFNMAVKVARELEKLNVYWLEEPLPKFDLRSLARLSDMVDIYIAGGEHATCIYELRDALLIGAYDVIQPDVILGNIGITGIRKLAIIADGFGKYIVPHVCGGGNNGLYLAATLQALGTIKNAPFIEYTLDLPSLVPEYLHAILKEPITIDKDGYVKIPEEPGIGIELNEEFISKYVS
ncbi:MAG: mandelate racemase/muconate lactonizing enzyme family protein [Candidatus Bathyarchaeia archaeon]